MAEIAAWTGAVIAVATLVVGYLAYRHQRSVKKIEYVSTHSRVVPQAIARHLTVTFDGAAVPNAAVTFIRLVNTGNVAIRPEDFKSDLVFRLSGVERIVSALSTRTRPSDLSPQVEIDGDCIRIKPTLLNSEDMLLVQLLTAGLTKDVSAEGRVADLKMSARKNLPYPPGSGYEGQMLGLDKFMWTVPELVVVGGLLALVLTSSATLLAKVVFTAACALVGGVIYPLYLHYLVRRRRLWRP